VRAARRFTKFGGQQALQGLVFGSDGAVDWVRSGVYKLLPSKPADHSGSPWTYAEMDFLGLCQAWALAHLARERSQGSPAGPLLRGRSRARWRTQ
jgi:hypothetical protein